MKKTIFIFWIVLFYFIGLVKAQQKVIKLWPNKIPGAIENSSYKEVDLSNVSGIYRISKVTDPTLTVFNPSKDKVNGTAIIICPGGGYAHLAFTKEGVDVAKWLNSLGVTAFVLKYRLPSSKIMKDKSIGPLQDAQRAIRIVRSNAKQWNLNPNKIGIMGFSAGGHLAASLSTLYNQKVYNSNTVSARPDFSVLLYPVISMEAKITHEGSRINLLGKHPTKAEVDHFSPELQVNKNTPPAFLVQAENDHTVPVQNSIDYFIALKKYNIPAELHIFQKGGHGFGLAKKGGTESYWPKLCENWMKQMGLL